MPTKPKPKSKANAAVQSAGPGMMFSKDSFFAPKRGPDGGKVPVLSSALDVRPASTKPPSKNAASVSSAGPGMMFSKTSFFIPKRGPDGGKVALPKVVEAKPAFGAPRFPTSGFQPQRHFVRDKDTGDAYAEWINGEAVCIHTGEVLFRSRRAQQGDDEYAYVQTESAAVLFKPDYSVPKQRHPNDYSYSTDEILASGFITVDDFKEPNGAAIRLADYDAFLKQKKKKKESNDDDDVMK